MSLSQSALLDLAIAMTRAVTEKDRFERLLSTVRQSIQCDAIVLLQKQGEKLKPLAQRGLTRDLLGRRFDIASHPRFAVLCAEVTPIRFPADSPLPDPYDGMLLAYEGDLPVHACMGLPLWSDGELLGVLTLDSMTPGVFDDLSSQTLDIIGALASATLKTGVVLQHWERHSEHYQEVVTELTQEALVKDGGELIGHSPAMQQLKKELTLVAPSDFTILIEGESGVGKELVARNLHQQSTRADGPLVYVNCAAIPENLVESELFGHVKGAFTGADRNRVGKFSLANGGTLFLDEVGELPLASQSKLLRALQSQEIQPVGQDRVEKVNVRVLAATNRVLEEEVAARRFRLDLYHRLSVYPVKVPPLRDREGDVSLLAGHFAERMRRKLGMIQLLLSEDALGVLQRYDWPGNVRELEHVIGRAALHAKAQGAHKMTRITAQHLDYLTPASVSSHPQIHAAESVSVSNLHLKQATEAFQRQIIQQTLQANQQNWSAAARSLGVDRANLVRLSKRLGISG